MQPKQTELGLPKTTRSPELIEICDTNFGNWGEDCRICPLLADCTPKIGDSTEKLISRLNRAAIRYLNSNK